MVRLVLRPGLHAARRRDAPDGALRQAYHSRLPLIAGAWCCRRASTQASYLSNTRIGGSCAWIVRGNVRVIEPDMQISSIRLSDKTSFARARRMAIGT